MVTKGQKMTLGGSWLLLTLLMIGMSWSQAVAPATDPIAANTAVDEGTNAVDPLALSLAEVGPADSESFGFAAEDELIGSRTAYAKNYLGEDGQKVAVVSPNPIHYMDEGVWEEIDLNLESTADGWEVTENTFSTWFAKDASNGARLVIDESVDPIVTGLNPTVVMLEKDGNQPMVYVDDSQGLMPEVGANVIRYPLAEGISVDYQVTSTNVKQNLVLREAPYLPEGFEGEFGLAEEMLLPVGYSLFDGERALREGEVLRTNAAVDIRNTETGELLASLGVPIAQSVEAGADPVEATYILRQVGQHVQVTTVVDAAWLLNESTVFPVMIDPTVDASPSSGGYFYRYYYSSSWSSRWYSYAYSASYFQGCKGNGNYYTTCTSSSSYSNYLRGGWFRFNLGNTMPTGATVTDVDFESRARTFRSGARNYELATMRSGSALSSSMVDPSSVGHSKALYGQNSPATSASTSLSNPGYGAVRSLSMNSNGISDVQDAADGNAAGSSGNIMGLIVRPASNAPFWYWCTNSYYSYYGCTSSANYAHLEITYTGGSDTTPPTATFTPYTGLTSYLTGSRTLFISLLDTSGVDTSSTNPVTLHHRTGTGSWSMVTATTIGTCQAGVTCNFKATIPAGSVGDDIEYFWTFADTPANGNPNVASLPAGATMTGTTSVSAAPTSPYTYSLEDTINAAQGDNKWQIQVNGVNSYSYYSAQRYYNWQMTYYEDNREYHWEYDTSNCGTGSLSCFNSASVLDLRYYPGTSRVCTSTNCRNNVQKVTLPGLSLTSDDGPGSDIIYHFDSSSNKWAMILYEESSGNGIEAAVGGGTTYTSLDYGSTDDGYVKVAIPGDITGYFGSFSWNSSYSLNSANRNLFCVNTNNNPVMFVRSTYTGSSYSNPCYSTYYYYRYDYAWNGWAAPGYDGKWSSSWSVQSKVSGIAPTPDTFPVEIDGGNLMDTYVEDARTLSVKLQDAGDPPTGVNVSSGTDSNGVLEGPHMKYRVQDDTGTWSSWSTRALAPSGASRAACEMAQCTWTTTIPGQDRGSSVEYTIHVKDNNGNWNNTSVSSYDLVTPTKVFVVEWHDMTAGWSAGYEVNYQVRLYDVSNEIEFAYDSGSRAYYDYQYIGFQDPSATNGEMLRNRGPGYLSGGQNPFSTNYRIATDGSSYGVEQYSVGMTELFNYNEEFTGSTNGWPYTYYCTRYWSSYRGDCSTVIDLPDNFEFDYFGNTFNGSNGDKIHAIRHGAMQFSSSSSTYSAQMMYYGWGTTMPTLPSSGSYVSNVDLAPWWGYYAAYYCYYNSNTECSIRTKVIPFDGAGMDITSDITQDTTWDLEQSPIRIIPSGDYLQVSADLTIEAGVEVQIQSGKGLVMTGACNALTTNGNETHPVKITNLGTADAKGIAFTNGCSTGTDDRHTFTHTNFENMDIAISAGSRHGSAPHYNGNVGNFTFDQVSFTNVSTAISHGSGQGTGFDLSGVDISNSADTCVVLPDDSTLTWVGGSAEDCNTHGYTGQGAVNTGSGSSVTIENVDITDAGVNGIFGEADSMSLSNVTVLSPGFSAQQSGTAVAQTGSATSGTSLYAYNVEMEGYVAGMTSHATDEMHVEDVDSTGDSNGHYFAPGGSSSTAIGATGWTMDGLSADGGMTMARTAPGAMDNVDLGGGIALSGTAPSSDIVAGSSVAAAGIAVNGCGWRVTLDDVTINDGSSDAYVSGNCASTSSSNVITVSDGSMAGDSSNNNFVYARNSIVTIAEMTVTGQTAMGSYLAQAGTNGDVRLIDVNFRSNDCADSSGYAGQSTCWVAATSSTASIYFGGAAEVSVYRTVSGTDVFQADHSVTTSVHDASSGSELFAVGSGMTDSTGTATVWLLTDQLTRDSGGATSVATSFTDHTIRATGGAGQNVTTPSDVWYTSNFNPQGYAGDLPLEVGEQIYLKLEAFPMDFQSTADCSFFASNGSASSVNGYYTYTMQLITLTADMVLDGCKVHLDGTRMSINTSAGNAPTITLRNGGELLLSEGGGEVGHIRAVSSAYGWDMNIENGGLLALDAAFIRDMDGGLSINAGATVSMINSSSAYGSPNAAASTATLDVDGGTLSMDDSRVVNANSGIGIMLYDTAASSLTDVTVTNAATGIAVEDAAPTINGFTLANNTVGMDVEGGMSLPSIYRSTILSGESSGWTTHAIDITSFANSANFVQIGMNSVYAGGNSDPMYNSYYSRYYLTYDRLRIAVDDGSGLTNVTSDGTAAGTTAGYYPYNAADATATGTTYSGGVGGAAQWDCNYYGYHYNPGGSYNRGYYYYMVAYGGYTSGGSSYDYPLDFGFRVEAADGLTKNTNFYPYHYWASYWPSWQYGSNWAPPQGFNGMWGSYNVCQDYAYRSVTPNPAGFRVAFPVVDVSDSNIQQVMLYVDMVHHGADYYQDRLDVTVRTGNSVTSLMAEDYGREFGTASISNGAINGADTGLIIGGSNAAGDFSSITVNDPTNEGVLIDGSTTADIADLTVNDGRYGVRLGSSAAGNMDLSNVNLDGQTQDGIVLSKDMTLGLSGTIQNAAYCGLKILSGSSKDWSFNGLTIHNNGIGVTHGGSGSVTMTDADMAGNTNDVEMTGNAHMTYVEGSIDLTTVNAMDNALLERARQLDLTVEADAAGVDAAPVKLLDADNRVVDSGTADANGDIDNMLFITQKVNSAGTTQMNLAGYRVATMAMIDYTSGSTIDARYAIDFITLTDAAGNAETVTLSNSIDSRICYAYSSSSYDVQASCSGLGAYGTRTVDGVDEYGYYAINSNSLDMSNQVIMIDSPFNYFQIGNGHLSFNNSIIMTTGTYDGQTRMYPSYPYQGHVWMDNTTVIAMGDESDGNPSNYRLGYSGSYSYGNWHINDSDLLGLAAIGTGGGYYQANGDLEVTDTNIVHYRAVEASSAIFYDDMCIQSAGFDDVLIDGNTFVDCGVGVFVPNSYYATSPYYNGNGTNKMSVNNNEFVDTPNMGMWYGLRINADEAEFSGNSFSGSTLPTYGIYAQDGTLYGIDIDGNTLMGDNPIYLRGAREANITDNTIIGNRDASNAGIYSLSGHGLIDGNTLIDADGGIAISGVYSGNDWTISDNDIGFSAGRTPTAAVGLNLDSCGLQTINLENNNVESVMNAMLVDGCDITDTGSTYTGLGGAATRIHNVDIQSGTYVPENLTISVGDSVRWTISAYGSNGNPHSATADNGDFDSGMMNLGSSFMHTFTSTGTWSYGTSNTGNPNMAGNITVQTASSSNLQTNAFDFAGANDDITFDAVTVSGYGTAITMEGGSLTLEGGTTIAADTLAVELTNVDFTSDGASLHADDGYGVALDVTSDNGNHDLIMDDLSVSGDVGVLADGHESFRWNGGTSDAGTTLQTRNGASGYIENMSWADTDTQIDAGAYSTVTSLSNGVLDNTKLVIDSDAIVREGNLLDLTVTYMGGSAEDVGVAIRSTDLARAEYISPSYRSRAGRTVTVDGYLNDWLGDNMLNSADDMHPGPVAVNQTTGAHMRVTWDSNYAYIAIVGAVFSLTDGMVYLDTGAGGSAQGDTWYVSHTLPFQADHMLWMEDLNNWGIRKVMPTGNWVDTTSSCSGIDAHLAQDLSNPVSEWRVPWDCLGNPTEDVGWLAIVQWDPYPGVVAAVYPEQTFNNATNQAQTFTEFGTFDISVEHGDLDDGIMEDFPLIFREYRGSTTPSAAKAYMIDAKVRNAEGDYWDWGFHAPVIMSSNQDVTIDILRAKPVIENLVDVSYDEDSGEHIITLTDKAADYQDASSELTWTVTDAASNTHTYPDPYTYELTGQTLTMNTLQDQFGGHRLQLTVMDSHGLTATQSIMVGIWNVNDQPVICNSNRFDCMPVLYDDGLGNLNIKDENFNGIVPTELGDTSNASRSYIIDMANEQTQTDWNNEDVPQTYTWTASDGGDCVPFSADVVSNVLQITENTANEAGGTCTITLSLTDGVDTATDYDVDFTVNPVNDAPEIKDFDVMNGSYVEVGNGTTQLDWFWDVAEDDENEDNLTFDLSRLMKDNDHPLDELTWSVEETQLCTYENYFSITVDNDADTMALDLIPDAATDAPTSEIDYLQDADGDGVSDGGIHQMQPPSGVYCTVYLWLHDTPDAPSHIDYEQSGTDTYVQRSVRQTVYIRVINEVEARPDYHFDEDGGFDFLNVEAILPGTRVPIDISLTNDGDDPELYNYAHDLQIRFYVDDNPTVLQDQITLSWADDEVPGIGDDAEVRGWVTLNSASTEVRAFIEVRTINPHTGEYVDSTIRRPALEELNWANNNVTTTDTADELPQIVSLRPAMSVASFAPALMSITLVGAFIGLLLSRNNGSEEEEEELVKDEFAVSPVIATILLVAITVVLSGVIYIWANSLADTSGKANPRLTFDADARFEHTSDQDMWYWRIAVTSHDNELASQAVLVMVEWVDENGDLQLHTTHLAERDGVYGRVPSNSDAMVTYKDDINCNIDCSVGFGANDIIQVRMLHNGTPIQDATITLQYAPAGGTSTPLMVYAASFNPPSIRAA